MAQSDGQLISKCLETLRLSSPPSNQQKYTTCPLDTPFLCPLSGAETGIYLTDGQQALAYLWSRHGIWVRRPEEVLGYLHLYLAHYAQLRSRKHHDHNDTNDLHETSWQNILTWVPEDEGDEEERLVMDRLAKEHDITKCEAVKGGWWCLGDALCLEDSAIRFTLYRRTLEAMLTRQAQERQHDMTVGQGKNKELCLFCPKEFDTCHTALFQHMFQVHGLNIGLPDNLVMRRDFIAALRRRLNGDDASPALHVSSADADPAELDEEGRFTCLYCSGRFTEAATLRRHMRKKGHVKVHPKDGTFDKYYMINYLEPAKRWSTKLGPWQHRPRGASGASPMPMPLTPCTFSTDDEASSRGMDGLSDDDDDTWDDWCLPTPNTNGGLNASTVHRTPAAGPVTGPLPGESEGDHAARVAQHTTSLFTAQLYATPEEALQADADRFGFDLPKVAARLGLDLYGRIRLVNYLRSRTHVAMTCVWCETQFEGIQALTRHHEGHDGPCQGGGIPEAWLARDSLPWDEGATGDAPRYLFPVFEDDPLLTVLDFSDDEDDDDEQMACMLP